MDTARILEETGEGDNLVVVVLGEDMMTSNDRRKLLLAVSINDRHSLTKTG